MGAVAKPGTYDFSLIAHIECPEPLIISMMVQNHSKHTLFLNKLGCGKVIALFFEIVYQLKNNCAVAEVHGRN